MTLWLRDFEIKDKKIFVKTTGASLPFSFGLFFEALSWFPFYGMEKWRKLRRTTDNSPILTLAFTPITPRPWYMLWVSAHRADIGLTNNLRQADAIVFFEDQTQSTPPDIPKSCAYKSINFACTDISKSKVATAFQDVFGYALGVDPTVYRGPMAAKSEINGLHDGQVVNGPRQAIDGTAYQKLIDNTDAGGFVEDLRCPVVQGEMAVLYVKKRPITKRFANFNTSVILQNPKNRLSIHERGQITRFCAAMGLEWGSLDVLRDQQDGKIYIVDVNKTEMGPPISLSLRDKNTATTILTKQLLALIQYKKSQNPNIAKPPS